MEVMSEILDETEIDISTKVSAAVASSWVVTLYSRHVPEDMKLPGEEADVAFWGSGTIIECDKDVFLNKYVSTIITAATLFERTNAVNPLQLEVAEDSPACSMIRPKDVIVECNGKLVCSKLEFFDVIWDMAGESVEVKVLRASDGETLNLSLTVGETTPDKFYNGRELVW